METERSKEKGPRKCRAQCGTYGHCTRSWLWPEELGVSSVSQVSALFSHSSSSRTLVLTDRLLCCVLIWFLWSCFAPLFFSSFSPFFLTVTILAHFGRFTHPLCAVGTQESVLGNALRFLSSVAAITDSLIHDDESFTFCASCVTAYLGDSYRVIVSALSSEHLNFGSFIL